MKVSLKAVPQFMAQGHMGGDRACHDRAFGSEDVPNGASHGGRQIRLLSAHAFGMRAKMRNVIPHLPIDTHLIHDPVIGGPHVEGNKFRAGHLLLRAPLASTQAQNQCCQNQTAKPCGSTQKKFRDWQLHEYVQIFDELYFKN